MRTAQEPKETSSTTIESTTNAPEMEKLTFDPIQASTPEDRVKLELPVLLPDPVEVTLANNQLALITQTNLLGVYFPSMVLKEDELGKMTKGARIAFIGHRVATNAESQEDAQGNTNLVLTAELDSEGNPVLLDEEPVELATCSLKAAKNARQGRVAGMAEMNNWSGVLKERIPNPDQPGKTMSVDRPGKLERLGNQALASIANSPERVKALLSFIPEDSEGKDNTLANAAASSKKKGSSILAQMSETPTE